VTIIRFVPELEFDAQLGGDGLPPPRVVVEGEAGYRLSFDIPAFPPNRGCPNPFTVCSVAEITQGLQEVPLGENVANGSGEMTLSLKRAPSPGARSAYQLETGGYPGTLANFRQGSSPELLIGDSYLSNFAFPIDVFMYALIGGVFPDLNLPAITAQLSNLSDLPDPVLTTFEAFEADTVTPVGGTGFIYINPATSLLDPLATSGLGGINYNIPFTGFADLQGDNPGASGPNTTTIKLAPLSNSIGTVRLSA
jgi:hypothetical protein